jgi:ABC-type bacteriocin/lantibiotic exporter with double-glycine peptidase domain
MTRLNVTPIKQPNDYTCGPASLKVSLQILGINKSFKKLTKLCKTNTHGTSTDNMIGAIEKLNLDVQSLKKATLAHIKKFLKEKSQPCSIIISYLYDLDKDGEPDLESGHWAVVRKFDSKKNKIQVIDSVTATRKSYDWEDFRRRWLGYDIKRYCFGSKKKHFKFVRKWQYRHMLIVT